MRIAAFLGVKDEVELIRRSIDQLRAIGVDHIIACDIGSTDGTLDVLSRHRSNEFRLVEVDDREPISVETWARREMELVRAAEADWCIFLDADELWIPASGSLKDCAALSQADVLLVDRYNVPLGPHGPLIPETLLPRDYDRLLLFADPTPDFRRHMEEHPDTPWIRGVPMPKVMARPQCIGGLTVGQHDVVSDHGVVRRMTPDDLLIAHLPFTTLERFRRKVENVHRTFDGHGELFAGHLAWHWRRWMSLGDHSQIEEEFRRQALNEQEIADLRRSGVIRSAAEVFQRNRGRESQ
jgi:glycosyltransferase involved in cell wall biosynthesis